MRSMRLVTKKPPAMMVAKESGHDAEQDRKHACLTVYLKEAPHDNNAADGIGHTHKRRMQSRCHAPDHLPSNENSQNKYGQLL